MDTEWRPEAGSLLPIAAPAGVPARRVFPKILQLTGRELSADHPRSAHGELADPATPWISADRKLQILGTGFHYLEYDCWGDFLSAQNGKRVPIELAHPDGTAIKESHGARDMSFHGWRRRDGSLLTVLYAGALTPTGTHRQARWPSDEWTRRVYAFQQDRDGRWIRELLPLFGPEPRKAGWLGYSYGHQFLTDDNGHAWVFYEKTVGEVRNRQGELVPYRTEIFARRMLSPLRAAEEEVRILGVGTPPYHATARLDALTGTPTSFAVEGARPVRAVIEGETYYLLGFSSGDFATDRYGCHLAWSRQPLGPYFPLLQATAHGIDLLDLGAGIRVRHGLSWGPARPCLFTDPAGHWWMLFHAVSKSLLPENDYAHWPQRRLDAFHRNLYLAPLRLGRNEAGLPEIQVLDSL